MTSFQTVQECNQEIKELNRTIQPELEKLKVLKEEKQKLDRVSKEKSKKTRELQRVKKTLQVSIKQKRDDTKLSIIAYTKELKEQQCEFEHAQQKEIDRLTNEIMQQKDSTGMYTKSSHYQDIVANIQQMSDLIQDYKSKHSVYATRTQLMKDRRINKRKNVPTEMEESVPLSTQENPTPKPKSKAKTRSKSKTKSKSKSKKQKILA